jgi:ribonuclease HII
MKKIVGIDEAGRGPVIGPMVLAGVLIEEGQEDKLRALGVKDSKLLTPKQREYLEKEIIELVKDYYVVNVSAKQIDELREHKNLNIIEADNMAKIINKLGGDEAIIDAPQVSTDKFASIVRASLTVKTKIIAENKADVNYPVCAAASILAKVERDRQIRNIEKKNNILVNTGYPHDPVTIAFLKSCKGNYPDFVRKSWDTASRIAEERKQRDLRDY